MSYTGEACDEDEEVGDESDRASAFFGGVGSWTREVDGVSASNVSVDGWVEITPR